MFFATPCFASYVSISIDRNEMGSVLTQRHVNPFKANVPFLYPLKTSENFGFLTFSGGVETEHYAKVG